MERRCHWCGRILLSRARVDALYCSDLCRNKANRYYASFAQLPDEIQQFHTWVSEFAPAEAVSYRVLIQLPTRQIVYYPRSNQPSPRWDGSWSRRAYFRLAPFEPPVIPQAGIYGVEFYRQSGEPMPTPTHLAGGLQLVPLRSGMVAGDRWKPAEGWTASPRSRSGPRLPRVR